MTSTPPSDSRTADLIRRDKRHVWHPFTQAQTAPDPIPIRSARGAVLTTENGDEILDLISSWWVTLHGHAHPRLAEAVAEQARTLEQVIFAGFTHAPAIQLAERVAALLPEDLNRVFYSDNGSTAVEVAVKIAHQYWHNRGDRERTRYVAFEGAYHGDTVGAMSVGIQSGFFTVFEDLLFPVHTLPFPETWQDDGEVAAKEARSLAALDAHLAEHGSKTAAVIIEPLVQGAGGMRMCRPAFLRALADRLHAAGILLILDEVMTGFGRTGATFACLKAGITPDLICLSKGLSGGFLPLAVTISRDSLHEQFLGDSFDRAFTHGHSFTANPLGCAAGLASLDLLLSQETRENLSRIEAHHARRLVRLAGNPKIRHPRLTGTIAALDVVTGDEGYTSAVGPKLKAFFAEAGLLLRPLGNVVYLLPPYCVTEEQLDRAYDTIEEAVATVA